MRDSWNVHSWDYRRVLVRLHSEYGATPFFKITVEPNPRVPSNNSIRIAPSGLGLPDRNFYYADTDNHIVSAYKRLIKDVVILMRATGSEAFKFATDIFFYEKRIAEITPDAQFLQDPVETYNSITVSELKITAASLPLRDILVSMFPNAGITDETEVIVSSPDYLQAISGIVSSTDRSALNNYVIWTLVREYLPYLPSSYTSELQQYISEMTGVRKPVERWESCSNMVLRFMGLAVQAMLEKKQPISDTSKNVVENIFKYIKNATLKHIRKYDYPMDLEKHALQKVSSLSVQVGLPADTTEQKYLQDYYYTKLYVQKSNLFQNIFNGFSFLRLEQQRQYMEPRIEQRIIPVVTDAISQVTYVPSIHTIVLSRALLTNPNFDEKYPSSIIYGRIGVDMANAIVESILPYETSWTNEKGLLARHHAVVEQSKKYANNSKLCLSRYVLEHELASREVAELTSLSTLKHLSAVKIAHTGLKLSLENEEHIHQPTLEIYEDSAIFFISYSQDLCSDYTEQHQLLQNYINFKLTDKEMLSMTWNHVPAFSSNFICGKYKKKQCSDIL